VRTVIGIGDAFCSQIGPELYQHFAFTRQRKLVEHIHSEGAIAKLISAVILNLSLIG